MCYLGEQDLDTQGHRHPQRKEPYEDGGKNYTDVTVNQIMSTVVSNHSKLERCKERFLRSLRGIMAHLTH
jgi:hypothetical protein